MAMTNRQKARRHAERAYVCMSCGKVARGNGGKSSHKRYHERRGEGCSMVPSHLDKAQNLLAQLAHARLSAEEIDYLLAVYYHQCGPATTAEMQFSESLKTEGLIARLSDGDRCTGLGERVVRFTGAHPTTGRPTP